MTRKTNIDRLLSVNLIKLDSIRTNINQLENKQARDLIYSEIKSILENLRSILDYYAHDLYELLTGTGCGGQLYFPFVHPIKRNGSEKTSEEINSEFTSKIDSYFPDLAIQLPRIYKGLEEIQGEPWLSNLIKTVNPQKHDNLPELGAKYLQIGNLRIRGKLEVKEGGKMIIKDEVLSGAFSYTPESLIPKKLSHLLHIEEDINVDKFQSEWVEPLERWNVAIQSLIERLYELFP